MPGGCICRIEKFPVSRNTFQRLNEASRTRSPFNDALYIRINTAESVIGILGEICIVFAPSGEIVKELLSLESRDQLLVEKMGVSEEIIFKIPKATK